MTTWLYLDFVSKLVIIHMKCDYYLSPYFFYFTETWGLTFRLTGIPIPRPGGACTANLATCCKVVCSGATAMCGTGAGLMVCAATAGVPGTAAGTECRDKMV